MTARRLACITGSALFAALTLTACTQSDAPEPQSQEPTSSTAPSADADGSTPTPTESTQDAAPVTCENLISASLVAAYTDIGWSVREEPLYIASDEAVQDGLWCKWGDYSGQGSDNVAIFAYAPLSDAASTLAQHRLAELGWVVEPGANGTYLTALPEFVAVPDEDGYGATYLFGDGWVIFADTKQSLLLIEHPGL